MDKIKLENNAIFNDGNNIFIDNVEFTDAFFSSTHFNYFGAVGQMSTTTEITIKPMNLISQIQTINILKNVSNLPTTVGYIFNLNDKPAIELTPFKDYWNYKVGAIDGKTPFIRIKLDNDLYLCFVIKTDTGRYGYLGWVITNDNTNNIDLYYNQDSKVSILTWDKDNNVLPQSWGNDILREMIFMPLLFEVDGKGYITIVAAQPTTDGTLLIKDTLRVFNGGAIDLDDFQNKIGKFTPILDENTPPDTPTNNYNGNYDDTSDIIEFPQNPSISVSDMGLINIYNPSVSGLTNFINDLFPYIEFGEPRTSGDITDIVYNMGVVAENIYNGVRVLMNEKLLDYVIDAHLIPVKPTVNNSENIKVGYTTSQVSAPKISSDYIDFDCGELNIKEYYGSFMDYQTKCKLYLPFVGYVPLQPELWQGGSVNVKYKFNVLDGSFICCVISTSSKSNLKNSVVATYSGNCCVHIPISGLGYSNVISGLVSGVSSIATGEFSGIVKGANDVIQSKPNVVSNNGYSATSSYLGMRTPYLIIERPMAVKPKSYKDDKGFPSSITVNVKDCKGYCEFDVTHINIENSDDKDIATIKDMLNSGIFIN